jgi:hypothetical protein
MNRYSLESTTGRPLLVYAPTLPEAEARARRLGFEPKPGQTRPVGHWDADRCEVADDPLLVVVEGDVYAKPKDKPAKHSNGSAKK